MPHNWQLFPLLVWWVLGRWVSFAELRGIAYGSLCEGSVLEVAIMVPIPFLMRKITDEGTLDISETNTEISGQKTQIPIDYSDCQSSDLLKDVSDRKDIVQERKDTSSSPETEASEVCGI